MSWYYQVEYQNWNLYRKHELFENTINYQNISWKILQLSNLIDIMLYHNDVESPFYIFSKNN